MPRIDAFLKLGSAQGCSDVHLAVGLQVTGMGEIAPVLGTPPDAIDRAEDRERFGQLKRRCFGRGEMFAAQRLECRAVDGLEHELGRLAPGARADLLVLRAKDLALSEVFLGGLASAPGQS